MKGLAEMDADLNGAKPFASLSPTLLARKGAARPAMRPQLTPLGHFSENPALVPVEDDLGWNDMGHGHDHAAHDHMAHDQSGHDHNEGEVVAFAAPHAVPAAYEPQAAPAVPEVVRQREAAAQRVAAPVPAPTLATIIPIKSAAPRRCALTDGRRAAFTLRLDGERHLKLRLACTLANRSAQQLLTEALDSLLDGVPEVGSLAAQVAKRR